MEHLYDVLDYHERTKHRRERYAASLGYMDWETQPNPFRAYGGADIIPLTLSENTPLYHLLFAAPPLPVAPICLESLSQLLRYALGLAAWKQYGPSRWALRCNASSGNLHPTECYLIAPPLPGLCEHSTLSHYAPRIHALERLHPFQTPLTHESSNGVWIVLSSVIWREAWKYGERCWRYCQLDAGHAFESLRTSARLLGWHCTQVPVDTRVLSRLCGLDQTGRFDPDENESPDMLVWISPEPSVPEARFPELPELPSIANTLSPTHHPWPILARIDEATQGRYPAPANTLHRRMPPPPSSRTGADVILKRRSAQMMDRSSISESDFRRLLDASLGCGETADVHFALFVHRVEGIEPGLYLYVRNPADLEALKTALDPAFRWQNCSDGLYLLSAGDYRGAAQMISCNQEIARDGAFSFGMLCRFSSVLEEQGGIGYKNLYHQCGTIGQQLYLEATSIGLSATGIGCFLDDEFHALLGLRERQFQSLYHFTIGRAIVDTRITTLPPYGEAE